MVYFLLLDRKRRKPAYEDETEVILRNSTNAFDPPKKRIDTTRFNRFNTSGASDKNLGFTINFFPLDIVWDRWVMALQ